MALRIPIEKGIKKLLINISYWKNAAWTPRSRNSYKEWFEKLNDKN